MVTSDPQGLRDLLTSTSAPVIVSVDNLHSNGNVSQHFVLVTGIDGNTFWINDPGYTSRTTLDAYDNEFVTRGYVTDPTDLSALYVASSSQGSGLNVAVTDPKGQVTGLLPAAESPLDQIPNSVYFVEGPVEDLTGQYPGITSAQFVYIMQPGSGTIGLQAGESAGPSQLEVATISPDGAVQSQQSLAVQSTSRAPLQYSLSLDPTGNVVISSVPEFTNLSAVSGLSTYGAMATLTATLTSAGIPLVGETISFTLNEGGTVTFIGTATTNASGIATLSGVNVNGFNTGIYSGVVGASFAGESILGSSSAGGDLTINPARATLTISGLTFTYNGTPHTATVSTDPEGLEGVTVSYSQNGVVVAAPIQSGSYSVTATLDNPNYTATAVSGTLVINSAAPAVIGEQPISRRRTNKRGKPVGPAILTGFEVRLSSPLNAATATSVANYQVDTFTNKRVKKKSEHILHPITRFLVAYDASDDSVTLNFIGEQSFPRGGQITVVSGSSGGVLGASGAALIGNTVFTISPGGRGITAH